MSKFSEYGRDYRIGETSASSLPAGNTSTVDCQQNYLSNNEIDMGQKFKPFDLEAAKAGAPVMTRDGRPVRILAFDVEGAIYPVVAAVKTLDGKREAIQMYTESGEYSYVVAKHDYDLVMAPVKHRAWVNVHKIGSQYDLTSNFATEESAVQQGQNSDTYITTVSIDWEE